METNQAEDSHAQADKKLDVSMKKSCSPSPPLLLLPNSHETTSNKTTAQHEEKSPSKENSLVLIETNDSGETSLIINFIKANFPSLNIQVCSSQANTFKATSNNSNSPQASGSSRNCLSAGCFRASDRAASIDNSSLSSNSSSIDRQESKDSGFWSMSKNSFESMKSLSINDPTSQIGGDGVRTKPFAPTTLQVQKIEPLKQLQPQQQQSPPQDFGQHSNTLAQVCV